jgi:hypothetical protein
MYLRRVARLWINQVSYSRLTPRERQDARFEFAIGRPWTVRAVDLFGRSGKLAWWRCSGTSFAIQPEWLASRGSSMLLR